MLYNPHHAKCRSAHDAFAKKVISSTPAYPTEHPLCRFVDLEVIAESGFKIYHPNDRNAAENLPSRGKLDAWLGLRVCLAPSAKLREALLATDAKRRAGKERDAQALANTRAKNKMRAERSKVTKSKAKSLK